MIRNTDLVAVAITAAIVALSSTSADAYFARRSVVPCSLDGVNPAYHPDIFGNPGTALREYGFVQGPDRSWHVVNNCVRGVHHN